MPYRITVSWCIASRFLDKIWDDEFIDYSSSIFIPEKIISNFVL
jgi:hypothetical protein